MLGSVKLQALALLAAHCVTIPRIRSAPLYRNRRHVLVLVFFVIHMTFVSQLYSFLFQKTGLCIA